MLGFGANSHRNLETSSVQKGFFVFILFCFQDMWTERAAPDCEEELIIYFGIGGDEDKESFQKDFHKLQKILGILEAWLLSS